MNYKKFEEYDDYVIFKTGKVFSLITNRFIKGGMLGDGYLQLSLHKNGKIKRILTNRLMGLLFIPNPENKPTVDHINHNKLDNRIINLRWATRKEQSHNRMKSKNNTSGIKGVRYDKHRKYWKACIYINGINIQRYYKSKEEAVLMRREMEIKYLGKDYLV